MQKDIRIKYKKSQDGRKSNLIQSEKIIFCICKNLIYFSMLKGMSKSTADAAIDRGKEKFPIYETVKNKLVETLSYGQKRIVSLMSAVVTGAKCVIIDEATDWILITESWLRIPYAVSVMAEVSLSLRMISHLHRMSQIRLFS